jgi:Zn-dependent protease
MDLNSAIFLYVIIILSAVFHEYAHGWMAYRLGDPTAKDAGRLTLNPFAHIDPVGTVVVPLVLMFMAGIFIGWAKPVPYNPYNLSDQRYGSLKVAIAGPASNFIIALIFGLFLRFFGGALIAAGTTSPMFIQLVALIVFVNIILGLFNLIPFPPLDGSKVFADLFPKVWGGFMQIGPLGIVLAIFVAFIIISPAAQFLFFVITGQGFGF